MTGWLASGVLPVVRTAESTTGWPLVVELAPVYVSVVGAGVTTKAAELVLVVNGTGCVVSPGNVPLTE